MRRARRAFLPACLAVLIAGAIYAPLPYFIERPGRMLSLAGCIEVDSPQVTQIHGDYLLTSVNYRRATPAGVLLAWADPNAQMMPVQRVIPKGQDDSDHFARQRQVFATSSQRAAVVGLSAAGFPVDSEAFQGDGVRVTRVVPDSPADGLLRRGDVIIAVNGDRVGTDSELRLAVVEVAPVAVNIVRGARQFTVIVHPEAQTVDGETRPVMGIQIETLNARIDLPVPVHVISGRIGGPSAGLMMALTVYDKIDPTVDLAGGRLIAGTGTIGPQGTVGTIGGIDFKALAADRSGADVFLAPATQAELAASRLPADSQLEILGVTTFEDAVLQLLETAHPDLASVAGPPAVCPLRPAA